MVRIGLVHMGLPIHLGTYEASEDTCILTASHWQFMSMFLIPFNYWGDFIHLIMSIVQYNCAHMTVKLHLIWLDM